MVKNFWKNVIVQFGVWSFIFDVSLGYTENQKDAQ